MINHLINNIPSSVIHVKYDSDEPAILKWLSLAGAESFAPNDLKIDRFRFRKANFVHSVKYMSKL